MPISSPLDIAGCVLWLDASQDAYADGTSVSTWTDRSGSGNNATQGTAGDQPTFRTGVANGLPALEFHDKYMSLAAIPYDVQAGTSFVVCKSDTLGSAIRYVLGFNAGAARRWYMGLSNASPNRYRFTIGGGIAEWAADTDWHVGWMRADGSDKSGAYSCLGPPQGYVNTETGAPTGLAGLGKISSRSDQRWFGFIAEHVHYSRALSAPETADVDAYLRDKYGLSCWTVGSVGEA